MSVSNWKNARPKRFYKKALKMFGKPTFVANVPRGMAYWKTKGNSLFSEHYIRNTEEQHQLFGLFTCPTNTVYIPTSLLRPTDFSPAIRKLLINKSNDLYGSFCNILPPWIKLNQEVDLPWEYTHFQWGDPVGSDENVKLFLEFRHETMETILVQ